MDHNCANSNSNRVLFDKLGNIMSRKATIFGIEKGTPKKSLFVFCLFVSFFCLQCDFPNDAHRVGASFNVPQPRLTLGNKINKWVTKFSTIFVIRNPGGG